MGRDLSVGPLEEDIIYLFVLNEEEVLSRWEVVETICIGGSKSLLEKL